DRVDADHVRTRLGEDPWIESAESIRLPNGTLIVRVQERRAIARYRPEPEAELTLLDPTGRPFAGAVDAAGALPPGEAPTAGDAPLSVTALGIRAALARHGGLAGAPSRLTLRLPGPAGLAEPIRLSGGDAAAAGITLGSASDTAGRAAGAGDPPGPGGAGESEGESTEPPSILETLEGESGYVLAIGETGPRALLGQSFLKRRIARLALLLGERDALLARARIIDLRFADRAVLRTGPASG